MPQSGYTPILLYSSSTASAAPAAGDLINNTAGSELAINVNDGKLFYKDSANAVQVIAWKTTPTTAGGTGLTSYNAGDLTYYTSGSTFTKLSIGSANAVLTSSGTAPQWSNGVALTSPSSISVNSASEALRITQTGAGNALVVEDSASPDSSPFVIDTNGRAIAGSTSIITTFDNISSFFTAHDTTAAAGYSATRWVANAASAVVSINKSRGASVGTRGLVVSGDSTGQIAFTGDDGVKFLRTASITSSVDGVAALDDMPGRLAFNTTADGGTVPTERLRVDSAGYTQQRTALFMPYQGNITTKNAVATLTGAELVTGILNTTGTTYTITLPTGADIESALTWSGNGVSLDWWVINTASGTITIAGNGNTTLGALTVATGVSAHFRFRRTAANTFTVYRLG